MADTIKIRGGGGETPDLLERELGYNRNEKALYIGTHEGNVRLCGADDVDKMKLYVDLLMEEVNKRLIALEGSEEPVEPEPEEPVEPVEPEPEEGDEGEVNG